MEQIIEFELRVPGSLVVHVFLKLVIFTTKQNFKANLGANYLMLEMLLKAIYLASHDLGQVTKFNPKCKILNVFWT